MTEKMNKYRKRQEQKGLVQVRLWVEKEDEQFFKFPAKMIDPSRRVSQPRERYGRPATQRQIDLAEVIAARLEVSLPKHLYQHHVSLCGWIWANMSQ